MSEMHLGEALDAYLDNELSVDRALEARAHLALCAQCRMEFERLRRLREMLQQTLTPTQPSAAFVSNLRRSVRRASQRSWRAQLARMAWAVGPVAAAALVALLVLPSARRQGADFSGEVVAAHLRSLQVNHLTDVASSDRHTVKPWFQGKVPYSLPVRDFREQGFTLEGGRLDYLAGQPVAALVYRSKQHVINVFAWPVQAPDASPRVESRDGIHTINWVSDGMAWWAVSEVNEAELKRLTSLLQQPGE